MNRRTDWLIGLTMALTVVEVTLTGLVFRRPWLFSAIAWQMVLTYVVYILVTRNRVLFHLLLFGLACSIPQLATDWYHSRVVQTLVYDYALFRVLDTPDYIIAGWGFAFTQLGYLVLRLRPRLGMPTVTLLMATGGTVVHSWYEEMAYLANAWRYVNASLIGHVSVWVIVSFFFIIATVALLTAWLGGKERWEYWIVGGLVNSVGIFVYSAMAVAILRWVC
jgi:hypothetical protein